MVQQSIIEIAVAKKLNQLGDDPVISEVYAQCDNLRAKKYLEVVRTKRELAKKYAISPRTVTNWRNEGCPFKDGQWAVLDWMAERRYVPAGAQAKFEKQLSERKEKGKSAEIMSGLHAAIIEAMRLKGAYQAQGLKPPHWLRGFRALPCKVHVTSADNNRRNV